MLARIFETLRDPQWALLMFLWRRQRRDAERARREEYMRRLDAACMLTNRSQL